MLTPCACDAAAARSIPRRRSIVCHSMTAVTTRSSTITSQKRTRPTRDELTALFFDFAELSLDFSRRSEFGGRWEVFEWVVSCVKR